MLFKAISNQRLSCANSLLLRLPFCAASKARRLWLRSTLRREACLLDSSNGIEPPERPYSDRRQTYSRQLREAVTGRYQFDGLHYLSGSSRPPNGLDDAKYTSQSR